MSRAASSVLPATRPAAGLGRVPGLSGLTPSALKNTLREQSIHLAPSALSAGAEPAAVPGAPCPAPARAPEAAQVSGREGLWRLARGPLLPGLQAPSQAPQMTLQLALSLSRTSTAWGVGGGGQAEFPSGTGQGLAAGSSLPKRPLGGPLGAGELRAFLPQGPRTPSTQCMQMVVVALEPGTALELRLGAEVLVLAPHAALQLTLGNLALVVVPARVLSSSEALWFPAHARWLWPGPTQAAWAINVQDGSLCAQRAEPSGAPPAPEDGEARRGCRPPAGPWAGGVPGLSPSSPHTLLLQALRGAPARQGCGLPPEPRAGLRPLPAEFSLDLRGLGPPPSSELRPLPPSPSPSPRPRSCRAPPRRRPPAKARRRLFRGD